MIHIGITGGTGLVGPHLKSLFDKHTDECSYVLIGREDFGDLEKLQKKLKSTDVIVHLAGLSNRANQEEIYPTNIGLAKSLLDTLDILDHQSRIIFLSSVHRDKDTPYGRSKKDSELLIENWSQKNNVAYTVIISSHIFGESPHIFDNQLKLYTNSAFATFCINLIQEKESTVYAVPIEFVYAGDVCEIIFDICRNDKPEKQIRLKGKETQISEVYALLKYFHDEHIARRKPILKDDFEAKCYKVFLSYT